MEQRDPFVAIDTAGGIRVHPLKLKDSAAAADLFARFNPDTVAYSLFNEDARNALIETIKLATQLSDDEVGEINVVQCQEILDMFLDVSKLKKKIAE